MHVSMCVCVFVCSLLHLWGIDLGGIDLGIIVLDCELGVI
jgi:hypothetical protein